MKRIISIILILAVLLTCASAETDSFIAKWNILASAYGANKLSTDMISEKNGMTVFQSDNFYMILSPSANGYDKAAIISDDADILIPAAAVLGMCLVDSYDTDALMKYLGYITYFFLNVKAGQTSFEYVFGSYMYGIEESSGGYMFAMSKL